MDKKTTIILSVISVLTLLSALFGATFSYFTTKVNVENLDPVEIKTSTVGTFALQSGSNINLQVTGEDMAETNQDSINPVKTAQNETPIYANVKTTNDGGRVVCTYKIIYRATSIYTKSTANTTNAKEFTISGIESTENLTIPETSLVDQTEVILLNNISITASGINQTTTQNWTFTIGYYNQDFVQDEHKDETFGGTIDLEKIRCLAYKD